MARAPAEPGQWPGQGSRVRGRAPPGPHGWRRRLPARLQSVGVIIWPEKARPELRASLSPSGYLMKRILPALPRCSFLVVRPAHPARSRKPCSKASWKKRPDQQEPAAPAQGTGEPAARRPEPDHFKTPSLEIAPPNFLIPIKDRPRRWTGDRDRSYFDCQSCLSPKSNSNNKNNSSNNNPVCNNKNNTSCL